MLQRYQLMCYLKAMVHRAFGTDHLSKQDMANKQETCPFLSALAMRQRS